MCGYNLLRSITLRNTMVRSSFPVLPSVLFFSLPCSPWWWILFFCLGATPPPRAVCEPANLCIPLCACLLTSWLFMLFIFLSSFPFSSSIWPSFCLMSFSYAVSSVSVATHSSHYLLFYFGLRSEVYDLFNLLCGITYTFFFLRFSPPEVILIFHSRFFWSPS